MVCYNCLFADQGATLHCGRCGCCGERRPNWWFIGAAVGCIMLWAIAIHYLGGGK